MTFNVFGGLLNFTQFQLQPPCAMIMIMPVIVVLYTLEFYFSNLCRNSLENVSVTMLLIDLCPDRYLPRH